MSYLSIETEIKNLIESRTEGPYWDFKSQHGNNRVDLLHDIICMANNLCDRDAYIIFGVEDKTFKILGIECDESRRDLNEFRKLLRDKKFAGGIRPEIDLKTIFMEEHEIDVLIIKNSLGVPFYLLESFPKKGSCRRLLPYSIYTRVNDTNTEIDGCADINHVEYLWKKRLGIGKSVLEKYEQLIEDYSNWIQDWSNTNRAYHKLNPEFQIVAEDVDIQPFNSSSIFFPDMKTHTMEFTLYYHSTPIMTRRNVTFFDGCRVAIPCGKIKNVCYQPPIFFEFYDLSTFDGKLYVLFKNYKMNDSLKHRKDVFLEFETSADVELFSGYLLSHSKAFSLDEEKKSHGYEFDKYKEVTGYENECPFIFKIHDEYVQWKQRD